MVSFRRTVTVVVDAPSATTGLGDAEIWESVGDVGPALKVTLGVVERTTASEGTETVKEGIPEVVE